MLDLEGYKQRPHSEAEREARRSFFFFFPDVIKLQGGRPELPLLSSHVTPQMPIALLET